MLRSKLFKAASVVSIINILAMTFGFIREVTIGYIYGTSYQADSIITAFTIPNFLFVAIGGAINTAFISIYSKMDEIRRPDFVQTVYTILVLISSVLTVLFLIFPRFTIELFFGGMTPEALDLTSKLFMVTAPATFFLIVSMLLSGLNNVHGHYLLSNFSKLIFNAGYVMIGLALTPLLAEYSYALGASVGALGMLLLLAWQVKNQNLSSLKPKLIKMPELKKLAYLALPIMLGGATMQFYQIIQRIFASGLDEGAISMVNYTSKVVQLPQAVLMASVTTIIYPMLAKAAGDRDYKKMENAYKQGFRLLSVMLIPASIFVLVYAKDLITIVFEYGNFGANSTELAYPLLQIFAIAVFSLSLNSYITRFFYALENMLLPNLLNVISVFGINILVVILFIDDIGAAAIAYGTVISSVLNMLLLILLAKVKYNLAICSWSMFGKIVLFTGLSIMLIGVVGFLPIDNILLSLVAGGIITGLLVGLGLKVVK